VPAAEVVAPHACTVVRVEVAAGDVVRAGQALLLVEAMKMEHVVASPHDGVVGSVGVGPGDVLVEGQVLLAVEPGLPEGAAVADPGAVDVGPDLDHVRPDLAEVVARHEVGLDEHRAEAVARRHAQDRRTARENVEDLCDAGSLREYGPTVVAAQRTRRSMEDLVERTPGDGMVAGVASVNGALFPAGAAQTVVISYDYTVLAGTQGHQNHRKLDRVLDVAGQQRLPVVLFAEGGGGRPGDTDLGPLLVGGLDYVSFRRFAELSARVPLVGVVSGRCFAGNAALAGCCDVVIATRDANLGMGGPAMIEGGGLGVFAPEDVGPVAVNEPNGVLDLVVDDDAAAVAATKRYLSYFQGSLPTWEAVDQRVLRSLVPEDRVRAYDVRAVVEALADVGSVLELRRAFGRPVVTALARVEGRAVGIVANDPGQMGGAITSDAADKAARFLQLCDAFALPVVFLCDTPGFMVGPESEQTAAVRHMSRLFVTGAGISTPVCTVVLRKGYGLGAMGMAGGGFKAPLFIVSWPTGEFGGMGLEGAVRLGFRDQLAAIEDEAEREQAYQAMVAAAYEKGKALSTASVFEIDDVIDPAHTRSWITTAFAPHPAAGVPATPRRPGIDPW
jgi:acetyl-CoA carboxylase carboxyltransferase component